MAPSRSLGKIFEYTCTGDGTMGFFLSLVSKFFHDAVAPYKFQSVSIKRGHLKYILKFLEVLQKSPPYHRRVRYLCLGNTGTLISNGSSTETESDSSSEDSDGHESSSDVDRGRSYCSVDEDESGGDDDDDEVSEDEEDTEFTPLTEEELQDLLQDVEFLESQEPSEKLTLVEEIDTLEELDDQTRLDILMLDAIHAILELCSESLQTLSVCVKNFDQWHRGHAFIFPQITLPLLKNLTWIIPTKFSHRDRCRSIMGTHIKIPLKISDAGLPPIDHPILFPSLKRFHVDLPINETHRLWIEHCCPKLQYLRTTFHPGLFKGAVLKARTDESASNPVRISLHTPNRVQRHLIDISSDSHSDDMSIYENICSKYGIAVKFNTEERVEISVKRKDDLVMTEKDWEERKLGLLGEVGFDYNHFVVLW